MDDDDEIERLLDGLELPDVEDDGAGWECPPPLDEEDGWW